MGVYNFEGTATVLATKDDVAFGFWPFGTYAPFETYRTSATLYAGQLTGLKQYVSICEQGYTRTGVGIASYVKQPEPLYISMRLNGRNPHQFMSNYMTGTITAGATSVDDSVDNTGWQKGYKCNFSGSFTADESLYYPFEKGGLGEIGIVDSIGFLFKITGGDMLSRLDYKITSCDETPFPLQWVPLNGLLAFSILPFPFDGETAISPYTPEYRFPELIMTYDVELDQLRIDTNGLFYEHTTQMTVPFKTESPSYGDSPIHGGVGTNTPSTASTGGPYPLPNYDAYPKETPLLNVKIGDSSSRTITGYGDPIIITNPEPRDLGVVQAWLTYPYCAFESPRFQYDLSPFLATTTSPIFLSHQMVVPAGYGARQPLLKYDLGVIKSNGMIRVNRTVGFGYLPTSYRLNVISHRRFVTASEIRDGLLPTFQSDEAIFIPQWFPESAHVQMYGAMAVEELDALGDVTGTTFINNFSESNKTINQELFPPEATASYEVKPHETAGVLDHLWVSITDSSQLEDRTYPTTILMQDGSLRLLVFATAARAWEVYKVNAHDSAGGFEIMSNEVWSGTYYAARLGRLVNGSLFSTAWSLDADLLTFKALFKTSLDGGSTWGAESVIVTRVDSFAADTFDAFQPTWSVVESLTKGTLRFNNYYSDDMGLTWAVNP